MTTLSKTHMAARYLAQNAPAALTRSRALILDQALIACESSLASGQAPSAGLLRQVVIAVRDLTRPAWLDASTGHPDVLALTGLASAASQPPAPVLDEILSGCLQARFTPGPPAWESVR